MNGEHFRELIGGRRCCFSATVLRGLLQLLELPYCSAMSLRNRLYDIGLIRTHRPRLPVVSVGNLTLGGTGKTPMVAWLARLFLDRGVQPGFISRGYGKIDGINDEFLELAFRLPTVPHRLNRNRIAAAEDFWTHREHEPVDVLILDDAFQHRRIARDLDIVLLDASEPFGFGHVFPRGMLREAVAGLRRADIVLLSRADGMSVMERETVKNRVLGIAPNVVWGEIVHQPRCLVASEKSARKEMPLEKVRGKKALAFCGIGNPEAFRRTLTGCGVEIAELLVFPDHHRFTSDDWTCLETAAKKFNVDTLLCTMKDLVKIESFQSTDFSMAAVLIDIAFLSGESAVRERLTTLPTARPPQDDPPSRTAGDHISAFAS